MTTKGTETGKEKQTRYAQTRHEYGQQIRDFYKRKFDDELGKL